MSTEQTKTLKGVVERVERYRLVVRDERGTLHSLGYHGEVDPQVVREVGAPVTLVWQGGPSGWLRRAIKPV